VQTTVFSTSGNPPPQSNTAAASTPSGASSDGVSTTSSAAALAVTAATRPSNPTVVATVAPAVHFLQVHSLGSWMRFSTVFITAVHLFRLETGATTESLTGLEARCQMACRGLLSCQGYFVRDKYMYCIGLSDTGESVETSISGISVRKEA